MKNNLKKTVLLAFLAITILGSVLAGCSDNTEPTVSADPASTPEASQTTASSEISETSGTSDEVRVVKGVTGGSLAPYFYIDEDSNLTGVDIEIAEEVFNRLPQYELQIDIADALQGVISGQYDIAINNYGYTDTRAESYYYSYPYKTSFNVYIQRPDDEPLQSLQDLADRGYKIELNAGGLTANALEQWNAENPEHQIDIIFAETDFQVKFQHIIDGTTDVAIDDGPILDTLLEKYELEGQLVGNEIDDDTQNYLFPKNNTYFLFGKNEDGYAIREDVNKVLKEMLEDGTIAAITQKYLGKDTSPKAEFFEETVN